MSDGAQNRARAILLALRPQQWVKNLLVLLPLLLAHRTADAVRVGDALMALFAFCLCASGGYVINDLLDVEHDRYHQTKRQRPIAAAILPPAWGWAVAGVALMFAFAIAAAALGQHFAGVLLLYLVCSLAYSLVIKGRLIMDVIFLAGLYTLRLVAGGVAARVVLSPWLLAFSMFFFLSLAFIKRYSELLTLQPGEGSSMLRGRGYMLDDLDIVQTAGPTSGYLAVLVFCQYISSDVAAALYKRPMYLWLICPVLLYWITRLWVLARRRVVRDDPVVFAVKDRMSWVAGTIVLLLALAATL